MSTPQRRERTDRAISVSSCHDWGWKWVFRGLRRGWGPRWANLEGWHAARRPLPARVIAPMCSTLSCIPWGAAHTGGHLKAYLNVAAITVSKSTQGSNLFQLLERAKAWWNRDETLCVGVGVTDTQIATYPHPSALAHPLVLLQFQYTS